MKKIGVIVGISFLAGALFFALTFGYLQKSESNNPVLSPSVARAETIKIDGLNFAPLVKRVRPAVVKVISESIVERGGSVFGDDFFDRFFSIPKRREKVSGVGSGFFISSDGYILTNYHVVKNALKISIFDIDGKEYKAKKIGVDPRTDLALLKIKAKNLPFIDLGDSNEVEVGDWVLAIGNPFYQDLSVTAGIISAKGRQLGAADIEDFLQTDAAINRGNSGGPLVNMEGLVIGINSAIIAPSGGNVGIGFAIPSNLAKKVVIDLKTKGRVVRGFLGVNIWTISEGDAKELDLKTGGVLIVKVEENSPAEKAGLKKHDVVVEVNGNKVKTAQELKVKIANLSPGDTVQLTIYRETKKKQINIKVGEAPDTVRFRSRKDERSMDLGMVLVKNTPSLARQYGLKTSKGLLVENVKRGGVSDENRIKEGDVILAVNRREVESVEAFRKIIAQKEPGSFIFFYINRFGDEFFIKFRLPG
ncbi:MAG: Do family serine endopeptidase [Candidatus Aminicenantes bacterium]|nr:Do family serine endopeptidase [Candidatus Aminicenantes bacterium]